MQGDVGLSGKVTCALLIITIVAFGIRLYKLDSVGLSFDEVNKIEAAKRYDKGDLSYNVEHPMLMKSLIWLTLSFSAKWNEEIGKHYRHLIISDEVITRFPNILAGALTTIVIFFLSNELFNTTIALCSAFLWATGINAVAINRIAKEDSLLVLFMLAGFFYFWKGKRINDMANKYRVRYYLLSGASFGLMLASKYFPLYLGLNFLLHYTRKHNTPTNLPLGKKLLAKFFIVLFITFIAVNPSVFLPSNIHYLINYVTENEVPHHGYEFNGRLYYNNFWKLSNTTPIYFYLLFMIIKLPPGLLFAFLIGIYIIVKGTRNDSYYFLKFMLLFWLVSYSIVGAKWLRYTLSLMPWVYITAAVGIYYIQSMINKISKQGFLHYVSYFIIIILLLSPILSIIHINPYYMLYVNIIGGGDKNQAKYFPHDEVYDAGMREAVEYIVTNSPLNSIIVSDSTEVVRFYAHKYNRQDLISLPISKSQFQQHCEPSNSLYIIDQKGRRYFENEKCFDYLYEHQYPIFRVWIRNVNTTNVYGKKG